LTHASLDASSRVHDISNRINEEETMGAPGEIAGNQLRTIVERIEQVAEEIKELNEAKREIYAEAKSNGFDVKIIRQVIRVRKEDEKKRDEADMLLDTYLQAIRTASPKTKAA
jgi:uncharacterized protein (UPF0335 family)